MRYSLSFLGADSTQIPPHKKYGNSAVEAVLFTKEHLSSHNIKKTWENIAAACGQYGNKNVTFHFPMNDCDYSKDHNVYKLLRDSYIRAADMGLRGVVVHSNRIATCEAWRRRSITHEQDRITKLLVDIKTHRKNSQTWLGLENMPLVGNDGYETDPLFCTAKDFVNLPKEIGVVWDVCHSMASQYFIKLLSTGKMPEEVFVRHPEISDFDIRKIADKIVHIHFAAFSGYNNLLDKKNTEGILPHESDLAISEYKKAILEVHELMSPDTVINFEVQEQDYAKRLIGPAIILWADQILKS